MTTSRTFRAVSVAAAAVLALSSCSLSVADMSLPGGTDTGEDPILVKAEFRDVLDLVPQSTVKVNDVNVGKISDVRLDGETAVVTLELPRDTELPDNTVAEIRQTSLLGEKFVQLSPPEDEPSSGRLEAGDVIELADTGRNPEVEEVLGALSLLLNGGGVAQLQTITRELNLALGGREQDVKSVFRQIEDLMSQLDDGKQDIVRAIEGLNRLSISVSDQIETIDAALTELPSALRTIDQQRGDLVRMLRSLDRLSDVGVRVIRASKESTIESFEQLAPVLTKFADSGDAFVDAFHVFLTYPFVDEVVGRDPQVARDLRMGDYTNLSVTLDIALGGEGDSVNPPDLPIDPPIDPVETLDLVQRCLRSGDIGSRACRKLLRTPQKLINACNKPKNEDNEVCRALPDLELPGGGGILDGLPGGNGGGGGGGGGILGGLSGGNGGGGSGGGVLGGLGRPGFGQQTGSGGYGSRGPTMAQMMEHYDADLVSLMVPGMVVER